MYQGQKLILGSKAQQKQKWQQKLQQLKIQVKYLYFIA